MPSRLEQIYHEHEVEKSDIYGRRETGFVERKKANFHVGLN
jgi:hypothetical protein